MFHYQISEIRFPFYFSFVSPLVLLAKELLPYQDPTKVMPQWAHGNERESGSERVRARERSACLNVAPRSRNPSARKQPEVELEEDRSLKNWKVYPCSAKYASCVHGR